MYNVIVANSVVTDTGNLLNNLGIYHLDDPTKLLDNTTKITKDFGIITKTANGGVYNINNIPISTCRIAKIAYNAGQTPYMLLTVNDGLTSFKCTFVKKGTHLNERTSYYFEAIDEYDTDKVVTQVIKFFNTIEGVTASKIDSLKIEVRASFNFDVINLEGINMLGRSDFSPEIGTAAWVKDKLLCAAADKGVNYLAEDGKELYKPVELTTGSYTCYDLIYSPRPSGGRTMNNSIKNHVLICMAGASSTALDTLLGITVSDSPIEPGIWAPEITA